MNRVVTRAELARIAGVSRMATTKLCKSGGGLFDAVSGKGVDLAHPLVRQWLASHGVHKLPPPPSKPSPTARKKAAPKAKPAPSRKPRAKPKPPPDPGPDPPPRPVEDLEDLTVREVGLRFGSIDGFKRYVESLKHIAEYKTRELRLRQQRGLLIERDLVAGAVFPLIDTAFARLVSDVPDAVAKQVIARVESGGPETLTEVQRLLQTANSRVLKNLKETIEKLEVFRRES